MTHAIGVRATSFVASATLLGAAVLAALTMSIVQRVVAPPLDLPPLTIVAPLPPPVEPQQPRQPQPPPPLLGEPPAPVALPPIEPPMTEIVETGSPTFHPPPTVVNPQWVRQPRDLARYYPARALQREIEGRVVLECGVSVRGMLDCVVVSETPTNWGFGEAALRISNDYRMVPAMRGGVAVEARHRMVVPFEIG